MLKSTGAIWCDPNTLADLRAGGYFEKWGDDLPEKGDRTMSRIDYAKYLDSNEWRARAELAKARAGFRCQLCRSRGPLDAHHNTYARLGEELPADLVVLCRTCHARHHGRPITGRPFANDRQLLLPFEPTTPIGSALN